MVRNFGNDRINQLPMILSGIFYRVPVNGIRLSIFNNPVVLQNYEMPLLP
ncbi:RAxF-45 family protein [Paenibacillus cellulositrophicus]